MILSFMNVERDWTGFKLWITGKNRTVLSKDTHTGLWITAVDSNPEFIRIFSSAELESFECRQVNGQPVDEMRQMGFGWGD